MQAPGAAQQYSVTCPVIRFAKQPIDPPASLAGVVRPVQSELVIDDGQSEASAAVHVPWAGSSQQ